MKKQSRQCLASPIGIPDATAPSVAISSLPAEVQELVPRLA